MPKKRSERAKLPIGRDRFEKLFVLDSVGRYMALEAKNAGMIKTPYEMIEFVCEANQLFAEIFFDAIVDELEPLDKADEYVGAEQLGDQDRTLRMIREHVSEERLREMHVAIIKQVREELSIPMPVRKHDQKPWYESMKSN
jgi:hypothetical protein